MVQLSFLRADPEDVSIMSLRNVGSFIHIHTAKQPKDEISINI
jgi:hypothetical protein